MFDEIFMLQIKKENTPHYHLLQKFHSIFQTFYKEKKEKKIPHITVYYKNPTQFFRQSIRSAYTTVNLWNTWGKETWEFCPLALGVTLDRKNQ